MGPPQRQSSSSEADVPHRDCPRLCLRPAQGHPRTQGSPAEPRWSKQPHCHHLSIPLPLPHPLTPTRTNKMMGDLRSLTLTILLTWGLGSMAMFPFWNFICPHHSLHPPEESSPRSGVKDPWEGEEFEIQFEEERRRRKGTETHALLPPTQFWMERFPDSRLPNPNLKPWQASGPHGAEHQGNFIEKDLTLGVRAKVTEPRTAHLHTVGA